MLDDLGTEHHTDFMRSVVFSVIDERYQAKKPLIVTTNIGLPRFKSPPLHCPRKRLSGPVWVQRQHKQLPGILKPLRLVKVGRKAFAWIIPNTRYGSSRPKTTTCAYKRHR